MSAVAAMLSVIASEIDRLRADVETGRVLPEAVRVHLRIIEAEGAEAIGRVIQGSPVAIERARVSQNVGARTGR